jgi:recombination protein RecR
MEEPSYLLKELAGIFSQFPGIGSKSAMRMALHPIEMDHGAVENMASTLTRVKTTITTCKQCGGIADGELCHVCSDPHREAGTICVVGHARDMLAIEASGSYRGLYHVTGGVISPLEGTGPGDLNLDTLYDRCASRETEVILALGPTVEGDATVLYIAKLLESLECTISRLAHGLPVGADLEYVDSATISRSLQGRRNI